MKRLSLGLLIILSGILLLLANIDAWNTRELIGKWWPVLLIAGGALTWSKNRAENVWSVFLMALGAVLLLNRLDVTDVDVGDVVGPAIIIGFGVMLVMRSRQRPELPSGRNREEITAILGGTTNKNTSKDYEGAKVTAVMGGAELDLSHAVVKKSAVIDVFVVMGGLELRVPQDVIVKSRAAYLLGGMEDKTSPTSKTDDAPVLYIDGTVLMGGIDIKR